MKTYQLLVEVDYEHREEDEGITPPGVVLHRAVNHIASEGLLADDTLTVDSWKADVGEGNFVDINKPIYEIIAFYPEHMCDGPETFSWIGNAQDKKDAVVRLHEEFWKVNDIYAEDAEDHPLELIYLRKVL